MSKTLSQLTGREVGFTLKPKPTPSGSKPIYGIYTVLPENDPIVMKADIRLLASFGGALVGLPDAVVADRAKEVPMDEVLRDAIHEVFNVCSTPLSARHRVMFKSMHTEAHQLDSSARDLLNCSILATCFDVSIWGYTGGELIVYSGL
jgi:hypothetical protein